MNFFKSEENVNFFQMEYNLIFPPNWRKLQCFWWKTTLIFVMEDDPNCFIQIDADLNLFNLKKTLIIFQMEDDLNFFLQEWRPLFLLERKITWFFSWKWKTILCFSNQRRSNFFFIGRCHLFFKWKTNLIFLLKTTSIFWKMEDDQYFSKWKMTINCCQIEGDLNNLSNGGKLLHWWHQCFETGS